MPDLDRMAAVGMPVAAAELTQHVTRGVCRGLSDLGYSVLTEFTLANGRRVDVMALSGDGRFLATEVKVSTADFLGDTKWPDYLPYCDSFFFAVPDSFPRDLVPEQCGLIVADAYGAEVMRTPDHPLMHASRRRSVVLRFARVAADRLQLSRDPRL